MLIHDVIKIQYSRQGYLPNYPPHLISDEEMCDAFLPCDSIDSFDSIDTYSYFKDNYPCMFTDEVFDLINPVTKELYDWGVNPETGDPYTWAELYMQLVEYVIKELEAFKKSLDVDRRLPDWLYAYMIGSVVAINSHQEDIHDLLVMLNIDNLDDEFLPEACKLCYLVSKYWINRSPGDLSNVRPPGMFGEPHVIKQLKLAELGLAKQVI